ncbi:MAG: hypothetical protein HZA08_07685 [Nitrospirae bacterium]|nr:hypothetical protein [Nitrospirota bacterium]
MGKYILVLDQGVSGSRATLTENKGKVIAWAETPLNTVPNKSGWIEYKPDDILKSILSAVKSLFKKIGPKKKQISAIGLATQPSTIIVWDKETGKSLYNAISVNDTRGIEICREKSNHRESIRERTGLPLSVTFSAPKLRWLLNNIKQSGKLIDKGRLLCGTVNTFLMWHLTKGAVFATDHSNASRTLLFNILTKSWDKEMLELFSIPPDILPNVYPTSHIYGDAVLEGQRIPILASIVDKHASLIGNGCMQEGEVNITYGKEGTIQITTGKKIFILHGLSAAIGWSTDGNGNGNTSYILEGNMKSVGAIFQWMQTNLGLISTKPKENIDDICRRSQERIFMVPAITGLGSPYGEKGVTACLFGMRSSTTRNDIVRSAVEAVAFMVKDNLGLVEKDNRIQIKRIVSGGELSEISYLLQFQSDVLNMPVYKTKEDYPVAAGIAFLINPDAKSMTSMNFNQKSPGSKKSFTPKAAKYSEAEVRKLYERWKLTCLHSREWSKNFS